MYNKLNKDFFKTLIKYNNIIVEWVIFKNGDCYNNYNKRWMCNVVTKNNPYPLKNTFMKILEKRYNKVFTASI